MVALSETLPIVSPCLVLAHPEAGYAALAVRSFRQQGWDVYQTSTGPEARRLARLLEAHMVILAVDLPGETGWLTCDKLTRELPAVRVVLVAGRPTLRDQHRAAFVGAAALADQEAGAMAILAGAGVVPARKAPAEPTARKRPQPT